MSDTDISSGSGSSDSHSDDGDLSDEDSGSWDGPEVELHPVLSTKKVLVPV